jgi:hypothetical protein
VTDGLNIFVSGRTGTGKTYLVKQAIAACPRLLVYLTKPEDHSYPGVYFGAAGADHVDAEAHRRLVLRWWRYCVEHGRRFRLVYRPNNPFDLVEFDAIAKLVYACGDMTFVCEEVMTYLGSYDPRKTEPGEGVTTLLTAGRTRGITTWLLTQKPVKIDHTLTGQARRAYLFATHEPAEVVYIRQAFGSAAADQLQQLGQYEHVVWDETGRVEVGKA